MKLFSLLSVFLLSFNLIAQVQLKSHNGFVRCATVEYDSVRRAQHPELGTRLEFEAWLKTKIKEYKQQKSGNHLPVLTIPVVVHVIHNGDAVGSGENITDAQVLSQIQVLNEDYRKMLNSPGYNNNPVGADIEIEFCMAVVDPNGNATNGIDRVNMGQASWAQPQIESTLKPQTIWDPTQYLNIWTCRFGGSSSSLLGYAQFPDNSGLSGLNASGGSASTDGVIINYNAFGTSALDDGTFNLNPTYNLGRTSTHEIGHWLGLRHIWGDGGCGVDDFCNDTPVAGAANYGCPHGHVSCGTTDMIENYMDYTDDNCMNIFTQDQKTRIRTVLTNSPRRASVVASTACSSTTAPPVCNVSASSTTIVSGSTVNFTDNSTGNPTSWSWNFDNTNLGGVTPTTSAQQNPTGIVYNNLGTYQVQFTATNANGSCTSTITINVVQSAGCDTLDNFAATDSLTVYLSNQGNNPEGYIAGWNNFQDVSKAELYSNYNPYTHVTGMDVYFYGVADGGNGATVDFHVWNQTVGQPGTVLGTATATLAQLNSALAGNQGQGILHITFPSPVLVGGNPFYCGLTMNGFGAGDSLAIVTSTSNTSTNTGWEQWSDNTWWPYDDQSSWGMNLHHYMLPFVTDQPVSGTILATPTSTCAGGVVNFSANGTNSTDYSWYFPGADVDTASGVTASATYSTQGTYTAYLVINGVCSGRYTDSTQITISGGPSVTSLTTTPSCTGNDGQITVNVTNGTTPYQYSIDGSTFQSSNQFTNLMGGFYTVTVQDAGGCQTTDTVTIPTGVGVLSVTTTTTDPSCGASDGAVVVNGTGGTTPYTFSDDNGSSFNVGSNPYTFSGLGVGTYNIVVKDNNGCQGFATATLVNQNAPVLSTSVQDVSCNGMADGLLYNSATGGSYPYQYSIDGGSSFQNSGHFGGLSGGTYAIIVRDSSGCESTGTATINEAPPVTHTATVTNTSCGNSNGNIAVVPSGGVSPYQYSIDGGTTFQSAGFFNNLQSGTYDVVVVDANGCSSTVSTETIGGSAPFSAATTVNGETCMDSNGVITVQETGGTAPYQYSIDGGLTFQNTGNFSGLSAGTYNIVVHDNMGCSTSLTETLTNQGGFVLNVTPDQSICIGNSATVSAGGAGSGSTYAWDNGLGTGTMHVVSPTTTTTYTVTATDSQGCSRTGTTTVTVNTQPTVTITPSSPTICAGDSVTLVASGAQDYVWNTGATSSSLTVAPTSTTQYVVVGQNGNCNGSPVTLSVNVDPAPTVSAGADVTNVPAGGTVNFNNNGSIATSYEWNFGDGSTSTMGSPAHTFATDGTYDVVLTATLGNCTARDTVTIVVGNGGSTSVETFDINTAVTVYPNPNSGRLFLTVKLPYYQDVEVLVFDAVGQLINSRKLNQILATQVDFDLSNNAKGVYYFKVKTDMGMVTKQVTLIK